MTRKSEVLHILSDGQWHPVFDFHNPKTGSSGDRRLRELRQSGYVIEKRKRPGSSVYEYRWKGGKGERENRDGFGPLFQEK